MNWTFRPFLDGLDFLADQANVQRCRDRGLWAGVQTAGTSVGNRRQCEYTAEVRPWLFSVRCLCGYQGKAYQVFAELANAQLRHDRRTSSAIKKKQLATCSGLPVNFFA